MKTKNKEIYNVQQNLILLEKQLKEKLTYVWMNINKCREGYVNYCPICKDCEHFCHCEANFIDGYDNCYGD